MSTDYQRFLWRVLGTWAWLMFLLTVACCAQPSRTEQARNARLATAWLAERLWVREATGRNDGPAVAAIIRAGGGTPAERPEWCGFTQAAAQRAAKLPVPAGPGGSYNWFLDKRRQVLKGAAGSFDSVKVGHKVGIFSARRGRIAHITAVVELGRSVRRGRPVRGAWCIGGNEGSGTKAGMHRTFYTTTDIYAVANWNY